MGEKVTEEIVRSHFREFGDSIAVYEQAESLPPIVAKQLKKASKSGSGKGIPEFIISVEGEGEFLIVVECKSSTKKHRSKTLDKPKDYAVDGVRHYAAYLAKEYDVLAIAVSGQSQKEVKISHFFHRKNAIDSEEVEGFSDLASLESYINFYKNYLDNEDVDYSKLIDFTKKLNDQLHEKKIMAHQRGPLLSTILMALEDNGFRKSYRHWRTEYLPELLYETVMRGLRAAKLKSDKMKILEQAFGFIKINATLQKEQEFLASLIHDVDKNINAYRHIHGHIDILGKMYVEFLRYANNDKALGIVLTPPHITDLFAQLACVNEKSVALDNCAGTGGFLISAMKHMEKGVSGNKEKIDQIREKHLHGIEWQDGIFALATSNMIIHQDGKTNILQGDCFDENIYKNFEKLPKPNVGLLNPPFKSEKNHPEELAFVLNNLGALETGGTCIALVPLSCAIQKNKLKDELKGELMKNHTLEGVLSLPTELFSDSDVNAVTCAMIFTAHQPHLKGKKTFFAYCRDDGFEKRKTKGRVDIKGEWESIRDEWVSAFLNRKVKAGFSLMHAVEATDEWCVEAYMKTDYRKIKDKDFMNTVHDYAVFQAMRGGER